MYLFYVLNSFLLPSKQKDTPNVGYLKQKLKLNRPYELNESSNESYKEENSNQPLKASSLNRETYDNRQTNNDRSHRTAPQTPSDYNNKTYWYNRIYEIYNADNRTTVYISASHSKPIYKTQTYPPFDDSQLSAHILQNTRSPNKPNKFINRSSEKQDKQTTNHRKERLESGSSGAVENDNYVDYKQETALNARPITWPFGVRLNNVNENRVSIPEMRNYEARIENSMKIDRTRPLGENGMKKVEQSDSLESIELIRDVAGSDLERTQKMNRLTVSPERKASLMTNVDEEERRTAIEPKTDQNDQYDLDISKEIPLTKQEIESSNEIIKREYLGYWTRINFVKLYSEIANIKRRVGLMPTIFPERIQP